MQSPAPERKDLQNFHGLPRSFLWSHVHRHLRAEEPHTRDGAPRPESYALLAAFRGHWWTWFSDYLRNRFGRPYRYPAYRTGADEGVYRMPGGNAEVVVDLAGDWATGTDEAEQVARLIEADRPDYTIHLGDVYYVGDRAETFENFLGQRNPRSRFLPCAWPKGSRGSFALLGNHEMYSRGISYFEDLLPKLGPIEEGRARGQQASFFCLENEFWRIIALDTGYNSQGRPLLEYLQPGDCALRPELIAWIAETVRPSRDDPRGIILLSHHQYFSRFEDWVTKPALQIAAFFERPVLWFWGHEHRLTVYRSFSVAGGPVAYGRCVGHGGMPVDLPPAIVAHPECEVEFVDERQYKNEEGLEIGVNGYARLRLRAERLAIDYVDVEGAVIFHEEWAARTGARQRMEAPGIGGDRS